MTRSQVKTLVMSEIKKNHRGVAPISKMIELVQMLNAQVLSPTQNLRFYGVNTIEEQTAILREIAIAHKRKII